MGIHLRLGGDEWGIIFTWDLFQPSTPVQKPQQKSTLDLFRWNKVNDEIIFELTWYPCRSAWVWVSCSAAICNGKLHLFSKSILMHVV